MAQIFELQLIFSIELCDPNARFTGTDCRKVILRYHFVDSAA